jgi:hypothetical protein
VVLASLDELLRLMTKGTLSRLDVPFPTDASVDDAPYTTSFADGVALIDEYATKLETRVAALEPDQWNVSIELGDEVVDPEWVLRHAVHDASHHLADVGRGLHALGAGAPRDEGRIVGLFASGGGVPKAPIPEAMVGYRGVQGDRQAARQHHGRVWQALCLWSADVVERLAGEGHPIAIGNAGENVSVTGLDWGRLRPGTRVALGDDVLVEVSAYATPCKKNAGWFLDGDFNRMNHDRERGISRVYASVLRDGTIAPGDTVIVEPD